MKPEDEEFRAYTLAFWTGSDEATAKLPRFRVGMVMDCETVRRILFLYADNEMDQELGTSFTDHLGGCPDCQRQVTHACRLVMVVRTRCRCFRISAPAGLRIRILQSLPHRQGPQV